MTNKSIALSEPCLNGREWISVKECIDTGWLATGRFIGQFETEICRLSGAEYAVAVASGTAALQIALKIAGLEPDEEVLVPTVTFIATVNAVRYGQAHPVFMDCDQYYNIDVEKTAEFLTKETKTVRGALVNKKTGRRIRAVLPVHVFGHAADLGRLVPLCRKFGVRIVEDATESLGTVYRQGQFAGRMTGAVGDIGCYSFNGNKIITTGSGGMIVTNRKSFADRARYLVNQAKDDSLRYIHHEVGFNYRMNNVQAALGVSQLASLAEVIRRKKQNYDYYRAAIRGIPGLQLAEAPKYADNNFWMYALQVDRRRFGRSRDELMTAFLKENIEVRPLWYLNHRQRPYRSCQTYRIEKALDLYRSTLNLPCSAGLSKEQIDRVISLLNQNKFPSLGGREILQARS